MSTPVESPAPALIRGSLHTGEASGGFDLTRLLPAWIVSGVIHVILLCLFLLITLSSTASPVATEVAVVENKIEDDYKDKNLTNEDLGNDPDLPTNYNVDRIADVSVPGPVNPTEAIGILNAPITDAPPTSVAPPPGFGGGQGGAKDGPQPGDGNTVGIVGGLGGVRFMPGGIAGRGGAAREKMLREGGGNTESERAVALGIGWLAKHQADDGHWGMHDFHVHGKTNCGNPGMRNDYAGTGLALLPFLGAGEIHRGGKGPHGKRVENALAWLCKNMGPDGALGEGYAQGIATICLCEAYGMSADPNLRPYAQRAINKIIDWQDQASGSFGYSPKYRGDLSVSGWHIQALKSAEMAGITVPRATWAGVRKFLDHVASQDQSAYGYTGPFPEPSINQRLTAVGLLSRQYTGWEPRNPGLVKGVEHLKKLPPTAVWNAWPADIYYYYYATQVMHHMGATQPETWDLWNKRMRPLLVNNQDMGGTEGRRDQKGSWFMEKDAYAGQFGRLGHTALCLLTLEVYYRHLPLYKKELSSAKDMPVRGGL